MLTIEDMQKPRTPKELMEYFWSTYDGIRVEDRQDALLKKGLWKNFFHELNVLNIFSSWKFPNNDVAVEYIIGNQGYDAMIKNGSNVEYIEIAFPSLGEQDKHEAAQIIGQGYSFVNRDHNDLIRRFIRTADKKSKKDYNYSCSSIIFALDTFPLPYFASSSNYEIIYPFIEILRKYQFKAQSVYLVLINTIQLDINKKVYIVSQTHLI